MQIISQIQIEESQAKKIMSIEISSIVKQCLMWVLSKVGLVKEVFFNVGFNNPMWWKQQSFIDRAITPRSCLMNNETIKKVFDRKLEQKKLWLLFFVDKFVNISLFFNKKASNQVFLH